MGDRLTEARTEQSKTFGQIFDEAFPHYLVMGMTPEQYWDGESWLKRAYRQAYKIRFENEERMNDRNAWLQGIYIREAFQSIAILVNGFVPKGAKLQDYPQKPKLEEVREAKSAQARQKKEENQMQLQMAMFQAMAEKFNKNFQKRQDKDGQKAIKT